MTDAEHELSLLILVVALLVAASGLARVALAGRQAQTEEHVLYRAALFIGRAIKLRLGEQGRALGPCPNNPNPLE